ncbi:hypothetical protein ACHAXR_009357 [Thalassiosira sp. AJA248-18]
MVSSSSFSLPYCLVAALSSWAVSPAVAFQVPSSSAINNNHQVAMMMLPDHDDSQQQQHNVNDDNLDDMMTRRSVIATTIFSSLILPTTMAANAEEDNMYSPKFVQTYDDFQSTPEGWSYKEVKVGKDGGGDLKDGDRVVFDWSGYTIGYFGRPFEAKGGPQGGAFDKDLTYFRTTLGSKALIPGLECALRTMKPGGIRQVIIPYGPLSYPADDKEHELVGPKPTTFSGMRALNFVLENSRVDRTLLFNVKLIRVDRSDGKGGFIRG